MEVDPALTVAAAHEFVEGMNALLAAFPSTEVLIHLDPEGHVNTEDDLTEADVTPHWFGKRI